MAPALVIDASALLPLVQGKQLIAVDGRMAVGKSTLARHLAGALRGTHVQTDHFIEAQWDRETRSLIYPDLLDGEALDVRLRNALKRGPVIVDGICVRDTLRRLGRIPEFHALLSARDPRTAVFRPHADPAMEDRDGPSGVHDAALLDDAISEEALMELLSEDWRGLDLINERSLVAYFKRFRPHHTADAILLRKSSRA